MARPFWRKFTGIYRHTALIWLNVCLLLLLANVLVLPLLHDNRWEPNPVVARHGEAIYAAYPGWTRPQVDSLLNASYPHPGFQYEPYFQFRERPRHGAGVTVSNHGFRVNRPQGRWPLDTTFFNIFVFGGSTTFGYGVPDGDTVPARLQAHLPVRLRGRPMRVYNFGRGYFFSAQERHLFESLIYQGHIPDVAIFIDGANDTSFWQPEGAQPFFTRYLQGAFNQIGARARWRLDMPILQYLRQPSGPPSAPYPSGDRAAADWQAMVAYYFRHQQMTTALAAAFDVDVLFVWQPVSTYRYDFQAYHVIGDLIDEGNARYVTRAFRAMEEAVAQRPPDPHFLNLAGLQEGEQQNLYVDLIHYNPYFSDVIAARIAEHYLRHFETSETL